MINKTISVIILLSISISAQTIKERNDLKKFFDAYNHEGCFILYDRNKNEYLKYNPERCAERFIPASTFKIFNSLAALESEAIKDENEMIKWDGVERFIPNWNQDLSLAQAFKYSTVWFYQELARRIGEEKMKEYITLNHYGNEDISGGIDFFWLEGGLRISPDEQIEFLKKIYSNEISFSQRSVDILKKIMIYEQTDDYIWRAKTGWGMRFENQIGWFVGYVEKGDNGFFEPWVHWLLHKIPPQTTALEEGIPTTRSLAQPPGAVQGQNSWRTIGYRGPAPPPGHGTHHYHFKLYALDASLRLEPGLDKQKLLAAMEGHVVAETELIGTYSR